jgi:hypothetical protein
MSVPVSLDKLRAEVQRFGPTAYLLTVSDDGRPHATSALLAWDDADRLTTQGGRRTLANIARTPAVSLLWPPFEPGGYSLIVDVDGTLLQTGGGATDHQSANIALTPSTAVLHRIASPAFESLVPAGQGDACGNDCIPLG